MATGSDIAIGLAYAILSGDWFTGGMSAIYGKGAMVRGMAFQAAAGFGLGLLLAAGVSISMPMITIAAIGASVLSVVTSSTDKKVEKIKAQAVKSFRKSYSGPEVTESILSTTDSVVESVESFFSAACSDMDAALKQDIRDTEDDIQRIIEGSKMDENEKLRQCEARRKAVSSLQDIRDEALGYCRQYGIDISAERK